MILLGACITINGENNVGPTIDMTRGPESPADDIWKGTYYTYATLPIYSVSDSTRIAELVLNADCEANTSCNFEVKLTYSDTDNVFRSGTIFASGGYSNTYSITGGTDSFNDATGTFQASFNSGDFNWYRGIAIDMCFIFPEVGDAVKCINDTDGEGLPDTRIYRMTNSNTIQYYPNEAVAFSWGEEWHYNTKDIDCTGMTIGDDIAVKQPSLVDGVTVRCFDDTIAVDRSGFYRWMDFELREYKSAEIANSWDTTWTTAQRIDCTGLSIGEPMPIRPAYPEGESVQCLNNTDGSNKPTRVYRFTNNRLRLYGHGAVANSWDPEWHVDIVKLDCTGLPIGRPMTMRLPGIEEGTTVKCIPDSDLSDNPYRFYQYTHLGLRYFPTPAIAHRLVPDWHYNYRNIDCNGIPHLDHMA